MHTSVISTQGSENLGDPLQLYVSKKTRSYKYSHPLRKGTDFESRKASVLRERRERRESDDSFSPFQYKYTLK